MLRLARFTIFGAMITVTILAIMLAYDINGAMEMTLFYILLFPAIILGQDVSNADELAIGSSLALWAVVGGVVVYLLKKIVPKTVLSRLTSRKSSTIILASIYTIAALVQLLLFPANVGWIAGLITTILCFVHLALWSAEQVASISTPQVQTRL